MEYHFNIEQGTADWFELKHGVIGGTRSKGLFTKTDTLFYELLAELTEPFDENDSDSYTSEAMERGTELEPEARLQLSKYTGFNFIECGFIQNKNPLLGISPDGITADFKIQCEIKCPEAKQHIRTCVSNAIPLSNIHQCIHAFTVNDNLETFYFLSYRPESIKPMFVACLTRNNEVNIGTDARPVIKTISECVKMAHDEAKRLKIELDKTINQLKF